VATTDGPEGDLLSLTPQTIKDADFTMHEVAAEVLIKEGVRLDAPWEWTTVGDDDAVTAEGVTVVLSRAITDRVVKEAMDLHPRVLVFLEDGFEGNDSVKTNAFYACQRAEPAITMKTV